MNQVETQAVRIFERRYLDRVGEVELEEEVGRWLEFDYLPGEVDFGDVEIIIVDVAIVSRHYVEV